MLLCKNCKNNLAIVRFKGKALFRNGRYRNLDVDAKTDDCLGLDFSDFLRTNKLDLRLFKTLDGKCYCKNCSEEVPIYTF